MKQMFILTTWILISVLPCGCNSKTSTVDQTYVIPPEIEQLPYGTTLGLRAPEIELPDTAGVVQKLSTLRGQLVLVDFWASWCNPCREENPELVRIYQTYHDQTSFTNGKGFEIFSVSLDRNEQAWRKAIEKDNLSWPFLLSDMQGARTQAAKDYNIQLIPSNFLLDQNGVIIASNLRGESLAEKLESLLIKK